MNNSFEKIYQKWITLLRKFIKKNHSFEKIYQKWILIWENLSKMNYSFEQIHMMEKEREKWYEMCHDGKRKREMTWDVSWV